MQWQSRLFNAFDYLYSPEQDMSYFKDSNNLQRPILVDGINALEVGLTGNVYQVIRGEFPKDTLNKATDCASSGIKPVLAVTGNPETEFELYLESKFDDIALPIDTFNKHQRGNNILEQKMYARFSLISKFKRRIINSNKRIWLLGFTQPHEIKRYGDEVFAALDNIVVKEAICGQTLSDEMYTMLHEQCNDVDAINIEVYDSIRLFKSWT